MTTQARVTGVRKQIVRGIAVLSVLVLWMSGCAKRIDREELAIRLQSGNLPPIVDVRSLGEFDAGHVPGAVHVPFYRILGASESLPEADVDQPIVVYCEHGPRAGLARAQLWFVSDHPVRFLEGHMTAWREAGLPMESTSDVGVEEKR